MAQAKPQTSTVSIQSSYRECLRCEQPDVLLWIERRLRGRSQEACIEMAARYFEFTNRFGHGLPPLKESRLNLELESLVPTIDPKDRWMTELPIPVPASDRMAIGRLLRAIVAASKRRVH